MTLAPSRNVSIVGATTPTGHQFLSLSWPPIFLLIGIPGNVISFIIWYRRIRTSPGSTCLILAVMCLTDTYVLVHGCVRNWLRAFDDAFYKNRNITLDIRVIMHCKVPLFFFTLMSDLSVWLIILLCVERFISVWFPIHMKTVCRRQNGVVWLVVTTVVLVLVNANFFVVVERQDISGEKPSCAVSHFLANSSYYAIWNYIDFAVYSFIPLALIVVLNYFILLKLHQTRQAVRTNSSNAQSARIFKTIACMCICHFVFTMPIVIFFLSEGHCDVVSPICDILVEVALMLQMANHMSHIFIYSWTSSMFQNDIIKLFDCWCPEGCLTKREQKRRQGLEETVNNNNNNDNDKKFWRRFSKGGKRSSFPAVSEMVTYAPAKTDYVKDETDIKEKRRRNCDELKGEPLLEAQEQA